MSIGKTRENLNDAKYLKILALEEFYHARQSGRLIALTGSYATKQLGYPDWPELFEAYFSQVEIHISELEKKLKDDDLQRNTTHSPLTEKALDELNTLVKEIIERTKDRKNSLPGEIAADLIDSLIRAEKLFDPVDYKKLRKNVLETFSVVKRPEHMDAEASTYHNDIDVSSVLFNHVGVRRVITTNYDLDLERERVFSPNQSFENNVEILQRLIDQKKSRRIETFIRGSGRVVSDVLSREEPNLLIEFLLGSSEVHTHILHIHGRQDTPMDMLLSQRDYRDLYWRRGYSKLPFEYALLALYSGNSILFTGLGMSEADVMRSLEQFRSDNPSRVRAPHFVIWNSIFKKMGGAKDSEYIFKDESLVAKAPLETREVDEHANNILRLRWFREFGVHVLFDTEVMELSEKFVGKSSDIQLRQEYLKNVETRAAELSLKNVSESDLTKNETKKALLKRAENYTNALRMTLPLKNLSAHCWDRWAAPYWQRQHFWSPQLRFNVKDDDFIRLWGVAHKHDRFWKKTEDRLDEDGKNLRGFVSTGFESGTVETGSSSVVEIGKIFKNNISLIMSSPGSGKGPLANDIAHAFSLQKTHRVVLVNGPFLSETDSIFSILSGAIDKETAWHNKESRFTSIEKGGEVASLANPELIEQIVSESIKPLVLVFNGLERLVGHDGRPLSIELDLLIRSIDKRYGGNENVRVIITGTTRIKRYISKLGIEKYNVYEAGESKTFDKKNETYYKDEEGKNAFKHIYPEHRETYFTSLEKRFENGLAPLRPDRESRVVRQLFYREVLEPKKLNAFLQKCASSGDETAMKAEHVLRLLTVIAYIGQPVRPSSLVNVSEIELEGKNIEDKKRELRLKLENLVDFGFLIPTHCSPETSGEHDPKEDPANEKESVESDSSLNHKVYRYGLHKSLLAELRVRNGVPHNDALLASGFNLSLFIAQPSGNYIPSKNTHERLDILVEDLVKTYQAFGEDEHDSDAQLERSFSKLRGFGFREYTDSQIRGMQTEYATSGVRAALSLIRSYYSTSVLLKDGFNDIDPQKSPSPLNQHADRIEGLIRVARDIAVVNTNNGSSIEGEKGTSKEPESNFGKSLSSDDLVWLFNELGVIYLTQGKLYKAGRALNIAKYYNNEFVEFGDKLHNWRRISLNIVQLMIDRGQISAAVELIRDIESSIDDNGRRVKNTSGKKEDLKSPSPRIEIVRRYAKKETAARHNKIDADFPEELILSTALCLGYRGICAVLHGAYEVANENYEDALSILNHLGEMRAVAWFKKHSSSPLAATGRKDELKEALLLSLASAGTTRQADIDHHARVALAWHNITPKGQSEKPDFGEQRIPQLMESLKYAKNNEMRRLQCEVLHLLASIHLQNKDYDSALRYSTDAMAVAAKSGQGLRKIGLRTLAGKILIARGNIKSGKELLGSALRSATSIGYQKAIEAIESERVMISEADGY